MVWQDAFGNSSPTNMNINLQSFQLVILHKDLMFVSTSEIEEFFFSSNWINLKKTLEKWNKLLCSFIIVEECVIDHCTQTHCKHGGKCLSSNKGAVCLCLLGFGGDFCEIRLDLQVNKMFQQTLVSFIKF